MVTTPDCVAEVLAATDTILLDFDGPVCSVFATLPDHAVASRLREVLTRHRVLVPNDLSAEHDPLEVLRYVAALGDPELTLTVDDELRHAEFEAVTGATPTPHANDFIIAAYRSGRRLAIVSNNSEPAIAAYLTTQELNRYIQHVTGRAHGRPETMKPNPRPVIDALAALGASASAAVLLGDSTSDAVAAKAAGVRFIGYASRGTKRRELTAADDAIVVQGEAGIAHMTRLLRFAQRE